MNKGIIYIVVGQRRFLEECIFSVTSLKKVCPDIPVTLFTDNTDVPSTYFDDIKLVKEDINPFKIKVKYMYQSPYEYTLFLDSDTEIRQPIYELFELLNDNDLALAHVLHIDRSHFPTRLIGYVTPSHAYNTGVILYKKSEQLEKLFIKWLELVMEQDGSTMSADYKSDQHYFNKLIEEKYHLDLGLKLTSFFNKIYNARHPMIWQLQRNGEINQVKILHCHDLHRSFLIRQYLRITKRFAINSFHKKIKKGSAMIATINKNNTK